MSKEIKALNTEIDKSTKIIMACEDAILSLMTIQNSLKLLRKSARKIYPENEDTKDIAKTILVVSGDIASIKAEVEDVASNMADRIQELKKKLEDVDAV